MVDELTRRGLLAGGVATAGVWGLAGCGSAKPAPAADRDEPTIEHRFGRTRVPAQVRRVVTLGFTDQDAVLALGMAPVGLNRWYADMKNGVGAWAESALGKSRPDIVCDWTTVRWEKVAALRPDLIVALYFDMPSDTYQKLSAIAPTIAPPTADIPYSIDWKAQLRTVGTALRRRDRADRLIADTTARIAAARKAHPEFAGMTVNYVRPAGGQYYAYTALDARIRLLTDLGFVLSPRVDQLEKHKFTATVSAEQVRTIDADVLLVTQSADLDRDPLLRTLDVFRRGAVVRLDQVLEEAFSTSSALSIPYTLDRAIPLLAKAVRAHRRQR